MDYPYQLALGLFNVRRFCALESRTATHLRRGFSFYPAQVPAAGFCQTLYQAGGTQGVIVVVNIAPQQEGRQNRKTEERPEKRGKLKTNYSSQVKQGRRRKKNGKTGNGKLQ